MERSRQPARGPATPTPSGPARTGRGLSPVLALQQAAGNQAVRALMRQTDTDVTLDDLEILDEPLSAGEVTAAIHFYTAQPARYTDDIVREIQAAVGVEETGTVDEETVQAVARWQRDAGSGDPALKVDGKAARAPCRGCSPTASTPPARAGPSARRRSPA